MAVDIGTESVDFLEKFVSVFFVTYSLDFVLICTLAECEGAFCNIFAVVVVDSRCADAFILYV